jgi:hypothetical protein
LNLGCNADYTNSDERGGFIFGTNAVCPEYAPRIRARIAEAHEEREIRAECPEGISFKVFVLRVRGGNNTIRFETFES